MTDVVAFNVSGEAKTLSLTDSSMKISVFSNKPEKVRKVTAPASYYWDNHTANLLTDGD